MLLSADDNVLAKNRSCRTKMSLLDSANICLKCKETCITRSLCCSECHRWIHYICSELPVYYILILENTKRKCSCACCAKEKICENYDKQYVQLGTELANEYQDRENRLVYNKADQKTVESEALTPSVSKTNAQSSQNYHQSIKTDNTSFKETIKSPSIKTKTNYSIDSYAKRKQSEQIDGVSFKSNGHSTEFNGEKICNYFKRD